MGKEQSLEYCSLHYLNQWLQHDKVYCGALSKGNEKEKLEALKKAASFYGIARNLPTKFDSKEGRYKPVLDILETVETSQFQNNPVDEITKISEKISRKYGGRKVLSLTTKFLWLKIKSPILIYDSQARIALKSNYNDYKGFYYKWTVKFNDHKDKIEKACKKLPDMHSYAIDQKIGTRDYIKKISSQEWFHERVFDIYLWSKGGN